jgi:hypothetical protein
MPLKRKQRNKILKEEQDSRKIIKGLNDLGLHPDTEGRAKTDVVDEIEEAIPNMNVAKKYTKYELDQKVLAILFMEAFQHEFNGKIVPKFSYLSKLFGYPDRTLQDWWNQREKIVKQKNLILDKGFDYVQVKLMMTLMRMSESMTLVDFNKMVQGNSNDFKNFIRLLETLINKIRLLNNLSTKNVEHQHHHGGVQMILPD